MFRLIVEELLTDCFDLVVIACRALRSIWPTLVIVYAVLGGFALLGGFILFLTGAL